MNTTNWALYWNIEDGELIRGNLVYSAYISPDKQHYCQWFKRDIRYHPFTTENELWTEELLEDRFRKELTYWNRAKNFMPVLDLVDVDEVERKIIYKWPGDDFLMQSHYAGSRENVLNDWQDQWINLIEKMWSANIVKLSLHPNSWTVRDSTLVPMNWFYCYDYDLGQDSFANMNIQISSGRRENLQPILKKLDIDFDTYYPARKLQTVAFNSFRKNYPSELMDRILQKQNDYSLCTN